MTANTSLRPSSLRKGFTLIEMLIVIAILAILVGIMIPAINTAKRDSQVSQGKAVCKTLGDAFTRGQVKGLLVSPNCAGTYAWVDVVGSGDGATALNAAATFFLTHGLVDKVPNLQNVTMASGSFVVNVP